MFKIDIVSIFNCNLSTGSATLLLPVNNLLINF
jgi:hypothetical protein